MEKDSKFFDETAAMDPEDYIKSTIENSVVDEDLDKKWDESFDKGDKIPNRILNNFMFFDPNCKLRPIESLEDETIAGIGEIVLPTSRSANDKEDEETDKPKEEKEQQKEPPAKEETLTVRLDAAEWSIGYGRRGAVWVKTPNAWYRLRNPHPLYKKHYQSVYIKYALCVKLHSFMKLEPDDTFEEVISKVGTTQNVTDRNQMRKSSKRATKSVDKDILEHPLEAQHVMQHLEFIVDSLSELKDDVIGRSKCWKKMKRLRKLRNTCHQCKANLAKKSKDKDANIFRCDECNRAWCSKCIGDKKKEDIKCAFCKGTCSCTECKGSNNNNKKSEKTSKKRKQEDTKDNASEKKSSKKAKSHTKYPMEDLKLENVLPNRIHDFSSRAHFELYDDGEIPQLNSEESAHILFACWQFINAFRKIVKIKKPISLAELEWMVYSYNNTQKNAAQMIQAKIHEHELKRVDYKTQQFVDSLHVQLLDLLIKVDSKASNLKSAEWISPDDVIVTMDYLSDLTLNEVSWPSIARQYITLMLYNLEQFDLPYRFDIAKYIPEKEASDSEEEEDEEKDKMEVDNENNNNNNNTTTKPKKQAPTYDLDEVTKTILADNSSAHANKNSTTDQANTVMFVKLIQALHHLKDKEYDELSPSERLAILKILLDRLLETDAVRDEIAAATDGLAEIRKQKYANKKEEQEKEQELEGIQADLQKNAKVKDPKKQKQTEKQLLKRQKTLESELKKTEKADTKMDQQVFDFKACMRVVCLGEDRHRNIYWLFPNPFGNFNHEIIFVEGSDIKQGKWSVIHSEKQLDKLLSILNTKGIREHALRNKIRKHEDNVRESLKTLDQMMDAAPEKPKSEVSKVPSALFKFLGFSGNAITIDVLVEDVKEQPRFLRRSKRGGRKRGPKAANAQPVEVLSDSDNEDEVNDDIIIEKGFFRGRILINMLLDFEERIPWNEVKKKKTSIAKRKQWRKQVKGAAALSDLVDSLDELLSDVDLDEFKSDWSHKRWENTLEELKEGCKTTAEFAIVFSSLKGAFSHLDTGQKCQVCKVGTDEYRMLLCDTCDRGYHIYCLDPPLASIPRTTWRCPTCSVH